VDGYNRGRSFYFLFFWERNVRFREMWMGPELCTAVRKNVFLDTGDGSGGFFF